MANELTFDLHEYRRLASSNENYIWLAQVLPHFKPELSGATRFMLLQSIRNHGSVAPGATLDAFLAANSLLSIHLLGLANGDSPTCRHEKKPWCDGFRSFLLEDARSAMPAIHASVELLVTDYRAQVSWVKRLFGRQSWTLVFDDLSSLLLLLHVNHKYTMRLSPATTGGSAQDTLRPDVTKRIVARLSRADTPMFEAMVSLGKTAYDWRETVDKSRDSEDSESPQKATKRFCTKCVQFGAAGEVHDCGTETLDYLQGIIYCLSLRQDHTILFGDAGKYPLRVRQSDAIELWLRGAVAPIG